MKDDIELVSQSISNRLIRVLMLLMVLAGTSLALSGCNTVEGVGKDIQKGGEELEDAAD